MGNVREPELLIGAFPPEAIVGRGRIEELRFLNILGAYSNPLSDHAQYVKVLGLFAAVFSVQPLCSLCLCGELLRWIS